MTDWDCNPRDAQEYYSKKESPEEYHLAVAEDKIDHIGKLIDLEWNGSITAKHCIERITEIIKENNND